MYDELSKIIAHREIGAGYRYLVFEAPKMAAQLQPGQFVHVRVPALEASALRRPFSVFDATPEDGRVTVLYKTVGRGTAALNAAAPGDTLSVEGPLGRGFPLECAGTALLVGGGYGVAPLHFLAKRLKEFAVCSLQFAGSAVSGDKADAPKKMDAQPLQTANSKLQTPNSKLQTPNSKLQTPNCKLQTPNSKLQTPNCKLQTANSKLQTPRTILFVGGRTKEDLLALDEFAALGVETRVATNDGSVGDKGFVTLPLDREIARLREAGEEFSLFTCGPDGLLKAVSERAVSLGVPGWISVDRHMICGVGACFACIQRTVRGNARCCIDGPVFAAKELVW